MNSTTDQQSGYQVDLAIFHGPLDLLLYLIHKEEVDIYDIPVSRITRQYLDYVESMNSPNLEIAGEYILMAATLIRIKTRLLLPSDETDPEEIDPREELVMALMEYRKFKEAGEILRERALLEQRNYVPPSPIGKIEGKVELLPSATLFDLLTAFREAVKTKAVEATHEVDLEEISIEDRIEFVLSYLIDKDSTTFAELYADIPRKTVAVVTFIALLELCRTRRVALNQAYPFSDLRVYRGERYSSEAEAIDLVDSKQILQEVDTS